MPRWGSQDHSKDSFHTEEAEKWMRPYKSWAKAAIWLFCPKGPDA